MKPKDLPYPFSWKERCPLLIDSIFYVPKYYFKHDSSLFPKLSSYFENSNPVHVEYCSGNGEWIIQKALKHPEINWIAIEYQFKRVRKIFSKSQNYKIQNLLIISGEALTFSKEYLLNDSIDAVYVNFPDPWPKERHAKNRLIQAQFINELKRILKDKGTVTFATDNLPYLSQIQ